MTDFDQKPRTIVREIWKIQKIFIVVVFGRVLAPKRVTTTSVAGLSKRPVLGMQKTIYRRLLDPSRDCKLISQEPRFFGKKPLPKTNKIPIF